MLIRFKHCRRYRQENKRQNQPYYLYNIRVTCRVRVHRRCRRSVSRDLDEMIRVKCVYTLDRYDKQRTENPINGFVLIQIEHPPTTDGDLYNN